MSELIWQGSFDLFFKVRLTLGQILMREIYYNLLMCHQIACMNWNMNWKYAFVGSFALYYFINNLHAGLDATLEMLVFTNKFFWGIDLNWQSQKIEYLLDLK